MGSELVTDSLSEPSDTTTHTEVFDKLFPYYISIGMSEEQYWDRDCELVKFYKKAHQIKLQQINHQLWWQGLYIYEALCNVSPLLQVMGKGPRRPLPYPKEPHPITQEEVAERRQREMAEKFANMKARMEAWQTDVNIERQQVEGDSDGDR